MKILILYFSGTGNTFFIADKIKNELIKRDYPVYLSSVEKFKPSEAEKFDILILGYPVYACNMPLFLQDYINKLTPPKNKNVIIFSTMGFFSGNAAGRASKKLNKIGMSLLHFEKIRMPGSDGLVFMKKESRYIRKILSVNFSESGKINSSVANIMGSVDNLVNRNENKEHKMASWIKASGLFSGSFMNFIYKFIEKILIRKFWADEKCIKCHLCEDICPSHNIVVKNDKVVFSDKCWLCMRCINQCPAEAIQIGKGTVGKFRWKGPSGNYNPKKQL